MCGYGGQQQIQEEKHQKQHLKILTRSLSHNFFNRSLELYSLTNPYLLLLYTLYDIDNLYYTTTYYTLWRS